MTIFHLFVIVSSDDIYFLT